jgi:hypothetical protein
MIIHRRAHALPITAIAAVALETAALMAIASVLTLMVALASLLPTAAIGSDITRTITPRPLHRAVFARRDGDRIEGRFRWDWRSKRCLFDRRSGNDWNRLWLGRDRYRRLGFDLNDRGWSGWSGFHRLGLRRFDRGHRRFGLDHRFLARTSWPLRFFDRRNFGRNHLLIVRQGYASSVLLF